MTLSQAVETIEKAQESITDKVLLGEKPYPPDEYFIAVEKALPYLECICCMAMQAAEDNSREFIPPELNADELPFG